MTHQRKKIKIIIGLILNFYPLILFQENFQLKYEQLLVE